jgi:hypothetical protein
MLSLNAPSYNLYERPVQSGPSSKYLAYIAKKPRGETDQLIIENIHTPHLSPTDRGTTFTIVYFAANVHQGFNSPAPDNFEILTNTHTVASKVRAEMRSEEHHQIKNYTPTWFPWSVAIYP